MSWSSGKEGAFALHALLAHDAVEVTALLTTLNGDVDRVAMHAVRRELVEAQADRLGLPLRTVAIPSPCPNEEYETRMRAALADAADDGVSEIAFGDLHLADVRAYRERLLEPTSLAPRFPLWGRPTAVLARELLAARVRAVVTCVDPARVPASLVGRPDDAGLLADLPAGADPCGENGELHTFVWDAPGFAAPISVEAGAVVERDGLVCCDLRPA